MRRVTRPTFTVGDALDRCIRHTQDEAFVARAAAAAGALLAAELEYDVMGRLSELYKVREAVGVPGHLSGEDTKFLYIKLSSSTPATREIYDHIRGLAKGMICPLCNQRTVSTLDHYLSKAHHGALSITPLNLVPCCKDCNTDSGARRAAAPGDQTIHPYFDDMDDELWLEARMVEGTPPSAVFFVSPPATWSHSKSSMAATHLSTFKLDALYAAQAGQELVNIYIDLVSSSALDTPESRRQHFTETSWRRRVPVRNSWQAALYSAAAKSDWFCEDGYLQISESDLF